MAGPPATNDRLLADLFEAVGGQHVIVDPGVRASFEADWTGRYHGTARCVARPGDTAQVAAVVAACAAHEARIVPQGGNTGLAGGSVPRGGEVVVSTRRLGRLDPVDAAAAQVTAGAGVTIADLQRHARTSGLDFAVDWGARDSATVGGAVATNAGGSRVVRFGTMRAQLTGIEAVLANGDVVGGLGGLTKETAGLHLPSLLCGSEGTLGIVTAARLRLVPWYTETAAALVPVASLAEATALLPALRSLPHLDAVELLTPDAIRLTCDTFGMPQPIGLDGVGAVLLVDCAADADPSGDLAGLLANRAGVLATGPARRRLLDLRDHVSAAINSAGVPLKLDVAVPVGALADLVAEVTRIVARLAPGGRLVTFGHLAEGNVHLNVLGATESSRITEEVLAATIRLGGTISAEHGIGVAKVAWLERAKGPATVGAMRAVKHALDPKALLNPGVLFG